MIVTRADLTLRRFETPLRPATAWLLGGADPASWLQEIARWRVPDSKQEALTLYVMPGVVGTLVAVPPETLVEVKPSGAAYARLGERLFLPVDAALEPQLSLHDLEPLLRHDVSVLHPGLGWVGFSAEQGLHPSNLIGFPTLAPGRWREPSVGLRWNARIVSVSLAAPVSFEEFFEEQQDDIGSFSIDEIPPSPNEPGEGFVQDLKRKALGPIARGARALSSRMPSGADAPTWVDRLEDWANQKLRHVSEELERLRNKEIHRLLELLESDAEKGLQHALPLGGGTHRGLAPPVGRLTARRVDFQLGALGGGRALDPWDVPYDLKQKLLAKYRDLANREKRLKRYRRAAYVYAELIGDLETAAAVLEEGKHFREAAEIYRKHLHKPLLAARTYESGGLFREAVEIYEELELWEEAGDVYCKMEQSAKARAAFERARDHKLSSRDRLGASRIVETKLDDVEGALEIVEEGWPDSRQASDCLKRQLGIQACEGLHERTETLLKRLASETIPPHLITSLVACLSTTATSYPNARVRHQAADLTRRKISGRLGKVSRDEAARLLESLYRLAPEDRLLARDGGRYLTTKERRQPRLRRRRGSSPEPELVRSIELPSSVRWLDIQSTGSLFFALAYARDEIQLYRGNWSGGFEHLVWPFGNSVQEVPARGTMPVQMELDATGHRNVILRHMMGRELPLKVFPASRDVIEAETVAGDPGWLPRGTLALSNLSQTWVALRQHAERLIISTYNYEGSHLADIADWERPEEGLHTTLACQNHYIVVGQTHERESAELLVFNVERSQQLADPDTFLSPQEFVMESAIASLRVAQPFTRSRVAMTMLEGVALHWLDSGQAYIISSDLEKPSVNILRNGSLVVVSGKTVRVYRTDDREPTLTSEMELPAQHGQVLDVVPGYAPNQFAIFTTDGRMLVFALPSG